MGKLDGRVAIVTGGGRGIGVEYAKVLAAEGAKVAVTDIVDTETTVNIIKQAGGEAIGTAANRIPHTQIASYERILPKTADWRTFDPTLVEAAE